MAGTITKIKNGTIMLPKDLRKSWKDAEIFIRTSEDTVVLKKIQPSSFWETWGRLKSVGKKISKKDIENAIKWTRANPRKFLSSLSKNFLNSTHPSVNSG